MNRQALRIRSVLSSVAALCTLAGAASAQTIATGTTVPTPAPAAAPAGRSTGIPQCDTLLRMSHPIPIKLSEQRLEDVMKFIGEVTGAEIEVFWADDKNSVGLDKDMPVTLNFEKGTALHLVEKILDKATTDGTGKGNSWQLADGGALQVGPKDRLNAFKYVKVYSIADLLVSGPSVQSYNAMAFDSARAVTVLFGYDSGTASGETWEWDGTVWTQRVVSGPSARVGYAMAYDSARGVTVLFGGFYNGSLIAETWEWDGTAWTQRVVSGPSARDGHAMVYDVARGVTLLFGGVTSANANSAETWEWNGNAWIQRGGSSPFPTRGHAMAYDSARGATVLFGGTADFGISSETWESVGGNWTQRLSNGPPEQYTRALAFDTARGVTVFFGSRNIGGQTWEWNGVTWVLRAVSGPSGRANHAMAYDSVRGVTVLFGGAPYSEGGGQSAETWEWNGRAWTEPMVSGPSPRYSHAMAYDSRRGVTVLFGGITSNTNDGDTWEWNGSAWTPRVVSGPSPRWGHAMAYDSARGVIVLSGGYTNNGISGETWEWDGSAWTQRTAVGPSARAEHAMVFDPARAVSVLFGGYPANAETWEWDGTTWAQSPILGPPARSEHAMAFDTARNETVLFGGQGPSGILGDTWLLGSPCDRFAVGSETGTQRVCGGGSATFAVTVLGFASPSFQWQAETVPVGSGSWADLLDGSFGGIQATGTSTATLALIVSQPSPPLRFRCRLSDSCQTVTSDPASLFFNSADFNNDGDIGTDADIEAFFACLAGNCCTTCGTADFNGDGDIGTDADIEAFFRVLAGGSC